MRTIPTSMATQHPDNAGKPYFHSRPFLSAASEVKESYLCFHDLGIDEYNWDWEGKFVDEAVIDRLLHKHLDYFKEHPLGRDKFLTFRLPNPRVEKQFRLARAFMVVITSSQLAQNLGFDNPPIFETILPLVETAEEIIDIQDAFRQLVSIDHKLLKMRDSIQHIEIIPLFEQVDKIVGSAAIVREYLSLHRKKYKESPLYFRPYLARSDPALNSGLVPTILALKVALSNFVLLEKELGVAMHPMVGTGSLPFRGGLTPQTVDKSLETYAGASTLIIQSAFRYDYPKKEVKEAIRKIKEKLPLTGAKSIDKSVEAKIKEVLPLFEKHYQDTIEEIAPLINSVSTQVARRRERVQHIGLFGYSRGFKNVKLPRAIPFTASLYSLGIPPELISTGRGIKEAQKKNIWPRIKDIYKNLRSDLITAGYFLNKDNIRLLARQNPIWYEIMEDIKIIEKEMGVELGPKNTDHTEHKNLTTKLLTHLKEDKDLTQLITYSGLIRKSLG